MNHLGLIMLLQKYTSQNRTIIQQYTLATGDDVWRKQQEEDNNSCVITNHCHWLVKSGPNIMQLQCFP